MLEEALMQKPMVIAAIGAALPFAALVVGLLVSQASATKSETATYEAAPARISTAEANAWAEARAADTKSGYDIYLAAFPDGAFTEDARAAQLKLAEEKAAPVRAAPVRVAATSSGRSQRQIAAACREYVNERLSSPNRVNRTVGGAAAGCAVGALAGGDDGRNCAVGAVAGGITGAVTAESRERRRIQEIQYCIARGGP
jgi:uncharacterized protein YcfJ